MANSAFDKTAGIIRRLAIPYDKITAGPVFANARPGRTNKPELIMAPDAIQKISARPRSLFKKLYFVFAPICFSNRFLSIFRFP